MSVPAKSQQRRLLFGAVNWKVVTAESCKSLLPPKNRIYVGSWVLLSAARIGKSSRENTPQASRYRQKLSNRRGR